MPFYEWPTYTNLSIGVITGLIALGMIWFALRRRNIPGAINLIVLASASAFWSITYTLEIISWGNQLKIFWEDFQYLAIALLPIIYFSLVKLFSPWKESFKKAYWMILLIQPVINQIVIWTNSLHHWFRVSSFVDGAAGTFPGIHVNQYGWWFWFLAIYTLSFMLADLVLLMFVFFKTPFWARGKIIYITLGLLIPWISAIVTFPQLLEKSGDYYLLVAVCASLVVIAIGIFRMQISDVIPLARKALLDQMHDAVIILNSKGHIVELNRSAKRYFPDFTYNWIGQPITSIFHELPKWNFGSDFIPPEELEITIPKDQQKRIFEVRISTLQDEDRSIVGWLAIFHNTTRRKLEEDRRIQAESQTRLALEHAQHHAEELSHLRKVNESLNQATSLRQALIPTLQSILDITHGDLIWVLLLENNNETHRTIQFFPDEPETPLITHEISLNKPQCIVDLVAGTFTQPAEYMNCDCDAGIATAEHRFKSHFSFPLRSGAGPLGVINILLNESQKIDEESIHLIESICDSLTVSIERIRLFKSEYDQRRQAETLQEIGNTLTASLDLNEVLDLLLEQIARLVPYDAGDVMFIDNEKAWMTRTKGYEFLGKKGMETLLAVSFPIVSTKHLFNLIVNKRPFYISDTHLDPDWTMTIGSSNFHSWLGAPVIINDKVVAIFSLDKKECGFYDQSHADRLAAFCSNAALAIQNAKLYESGIKRIRELESLQITLNDITSELDLKKLLNDITARAVDLLDASAGILGLVEDDAHQVKIIAGVNSAAELTGSVLTLGEDELRNIAEAKLPFVIQEYSSWENRSEQVAGVFPHALIQVPLTAGNKLLGAIVVGDANPNRTFSEEDVRLISLFAQQATIALTNARLFTDAKKRAEEAETLRQASAIVASSLEQKQALHLILEQLALVIPCDSASILLPTEGELEIVDGRGFTTRTPVLGIRIPITNDQPGPLVYTEKKSIIVRDMDVEYPTFSKFVGIPIQSWVGVPLIFQKKVIGILAVDSLTKNSYTEDHARLVKAFADQVAIALENVRLYEDAVKSAKRLAGLYKMSQRINANLRPEEVYRAIHKATIELMMPDSFILSMFNEETQMINDVYFVDHGIPQKNTSRPLGQGLFSRVVKDKKTIMYNRFNLNMLSKTKAVLVGDEKDPTMVRSLIIVPLILGKKVKGVLSAQSYRADAFSEEDKETLELLAAHAVIALDNARLFSEIQELAITDPLTKIFNRRQFFDLAEQEFDRSRRYLRPFSIIMFDIDLFKRVNDSYGHSVGDVVLAQIAKICRQALRDVDIFARYGGEEFVILLPETTATEAQLMAERLRQLIARTPMDIAGIQVNITLSFGVVEVDDTCKNTEDLLDRSDLALYHSKHSGRNCVSVWDPKMRIREKNEQVENP